MPNLSLPNVTHASIVLEIAMNMQDYIIMQKMMYQQKTCILNDKNGHAITKGGCLEKQKILTLLAHNVRQEMNRAELSSTELAKRCKISTGTISKILQGKMSISVTMAMTLAEGLQIDVSNLLRGLFNEKINNFTGAETNTQDTQALNIGIMSINNRRLTCIKNQHGLIVGQSEIIGGMDLAESSTFLLSKIIESIRLTLKDNPSTINNLEYVLSISSINLVTQSYEFENTKRKFLHFLKRTFRQVNLMADWQISYLANFTTKNGISLITDKGVSLSYVHHEHLKKLGGWKFPVYDLGGENWLGVETIKHTIEAVEGYIPMSSLAQAVMANFDGKIETITEYCFKGTKDPDVYCQFATMLLQAYWKGDITAKNIIARGFEAIYRMIDRVDKITNQTLPIAMMGALMDIYKTFIHPSRLIESVGDETKTQLLSHLTRDDLKRIDL